MRLASNRNPLPAYLALMRLDRPVGSLLLLWPTLAALWIAAEGLPAWHLLVIFTLGTFLMRSAGCVINDYADRNMDGAVARTRNRPLVSGEVSTTAALVLFAVLVSAAGVLVLFLNRSTQVLALAGLAVAILYPFMKRWTHFPQAFLGMAFSWGILMAWPATGNTLAPAAGLLFIGSVMWIIAYDTMYAMVDRDDDLKVGIKSTAILFGSADRLMIGLLQLIALGIWLMLGRGLDMSVPFYIGLAVCAGLFLYQQRLISKRKRDDCFRAFTNNIWVGFALFVGTLTHYSLGHLLP
ncbi:MAG: 4-hydroxybenzoate octaprenyltransferase [Pseudomonadota bacterium]